MPHARGEIRKDLNQRILKALTLRPMKRCQLSEELDIPPTTIQDRLKKMREVDMVEKVKRFKIPHLIGRPYTFWRIK